MSDGLPKTLNMTEWQERERRDRAFDVKRQIEQLLESEKRTMRLALRIPSVGDVKPGWGVSNPEDPSDSCAVVQGRIKDILERNACVIAVEMLIDTGMDKPHGSWGIVAMEKSILH